MAFSLPEPLESELARAAGKAGLSWPGDIKERLSLLVSELLRWNEKIRLVGFSDPIPIFEHLILEAFCLLPWLEKEGSVVDIGSGAGFPGLVLAACRPDVQVTSIEARSRKAHFQEHAARLLGCRNFNVMARRIEADQTPPELLGKFSAATAQALGEPVLLLKLLTPLLREEGRLLLPRGPGWEKEKKSALEVTGRLGLNLLEEQWRTTPLEKARRVLVILEKGGNSSTDGS